MCSPRCRFRTWYYYWQIVVRKTKETVFESEHTMYYTIIIIRTVGNATYSKTKHDGQGVLRCFFVGKSILVPFVHEQTCTHCSCASSAVFACSCLLAAANAISSVSMCTLTAQTHTHTQHVLRSRNVLELSEYLASAPCTRAQNVSLCAH